MAYLKTVVSVVTIICGGYAPVFASSSPQLDSEPSFSNLEEIIQNVNAAKTTWTAGRNFHPDVSDAHLRGLVTEFDPLSDAKALQSCDYCDGVQEIKADPEFDSRKKWPKCKSISHITNQGSCKSSWAVAAAGVITDRQCIASNGSVTDPMSAQYIMSCCAKCGNGNGCDGGWPKRALQFYQKEGVVTGGDYGSNEGCQPYSLKPTNDPISSTEPAPVCSKQCTNNKYSKKWKKDRHFGKEVYTLCCCSIKNVLQAEGPVVTSMIAYEDFLTYKSGIYQHIWGKKVGWHTVRLIGWGTGFNNTEYWIAANSWGPNWGEGGFFKIRRKEAEFETAFVTVVPKIKKRKNLISFEG